MKKKIPFLLCVLLILFLSGCGHKSKAELVDIEQFRCCDSIKNVFSVLGNTDLTTDKSFFGDKIYRYEFDDLNLFGYKGAVWFRVRDDKDTVRDFECQFVLNKDEANDLILRLSDRHGGYEKNDYSEYSAYTWKVSAEEDRGFESIVLKHYKDKKVSLEYSDSFSSYKDEEYYAYLEEQNAPAPMEMLADHTYYIGEDSFQFGLFKSGDELSLSLFCKIQEKVNAFFVHNAFNAIMNDTQDSTAKFRDMFSYNIRIGDGVLLIRNKDVFVLFSDKKIIFSSDYFSDEWYDELYNEFHEKDITENNYGTQAFGFMIDFIENYWPKE